MERDSGTIHLGSSPLGTETTNVYSPPFYWDYISVELIDRRGGHGPWNTLEIYLIEEI